MDWVYHRLENKTTWKMERRLDWVYFRLRNKKKLSNEGNTFGLGI